MGKYNIQKLTVPAAGTTIVIATDADEILSSEFQANGKVVGFQVTTPDLDGSDTATFKLEDADGTVLFSKASLAESTKHFINVDANNHPLRIPVAGGLKTRITASTDQDANRIFAVKILIDRGN